MYNIRYVFKEGDLTMYKDDKFEEILEKIDINGPAPTEEPMRQYYFIKKARQYVKKKSEELGRPLFACTRTFGCQMNLEPVKA